MRFCLDEKWNGANRRAIYRKKRNPLLEVGKWFVVSFVIAVAVMVLFVYRGTWYGREIRVL